VNPTLMSSPAVRRGNYSVVPYQSTHNTGGTMTGADPKSSVREPLSPGWDADNLFVMGASVFPQNASYTRPALSARSPTVGPCDHDAVSQGAGPLVHA